jgi:hypothetical protein
VDPICNNKFNTCNIKIKHLQHYQHSSMRCRCVKWKSIAKTYATWR